MPLNRNKNVLLAQLHVLYSEWTSRKGLTLLILNKTPIARQHPHAPTPEVKSQMRVQGDERRVPSLAVVFVFRTKGKPEMLSVIEWKTVGWLVECLKRVPWLVGEKVISFALARRNWRELFAVACKLIRCLSSGNPFRWTTWLARLAWWVFWPFYYFLRNQKQAE